MPYANRTTVDGLFGSYRAGVDLPIYSRCIFNTTLSGSGQPSLALAGASDIAVCSVEVEALTGQIVPVAYLNASGTAMGIANDAITGGNLVYAAANGRVASTGTVIAGRATVSAPANGRITYTPVT